jgi:hypothetical protein
MILAEDILHNGLNAPIDERVRRQRRKTVILTDVCTDLLLCRLTLHRVIDEATHRLAIFPRSNSRYDNLTKIAGLHLELGTLLSRLIYDEYRGKPGKEIACAAGCATCCMIPPTVALDRANSFVLTLPDIITLIENYPEIDASNSSLLERAKRSVDFAETSNGIVPCTYLGPNRKCDIYNQRPLTCKIWFSADLQLCVRNLDGNYPRGVNPLTDASNDIRAAFEEPFKKSIRQIAPNLRFDGYDYLRTFRAIALINDAGELGLLKQKIDSGDKKEFFH